jgi:glycosyltransferase involved in cell wall biosynthesis
MTEQPSELDDERSHRPTYTTLSVIMPVFNERSTVAEMVRRMRAVEIPLVLQVIVVDDGSSDGSEKVLGALEDSTVRVITHKENQGKGAAIRTGMAAATGDLIKTPTSNTTPTTGPGCSIPS